MNPSAPARDEARVASSGGPTAPPVDGRRQRSARSRQAIVEALLELLREGEISPSSTAVATRAGVTQRTVFNHFADMDALMEAAALLQGGRIRSLLPGVTSGPFETRLSTFVEELAVLLEDTMHVRWALLMNDSTGRDAPQWIAAVNGMLRHQVMGTFGAELAAMEPERRTAALHALDVLADAGSWRLRRVFHGQSRAEATAALHAAMGGLLRPD